MNLNWNEIDHITKVDPEKGLPRALGPLAHTDLVMVGGSDGVTEENTLETIRRISSSFPDLPVLQEPYDADQVSRNTIEAVDYLSIPAIFNGDRNHFLGKHLGLFAELSGAPEELLGADLPVVGGLVRSKGREAISEVTEKIVAEGYVIQNPESKAAGRTGADVPFTAEEVAGAALATETFYNFPIFYVEYSGTYGGPEDVRAARSQLEDAVLLYGGGIDSGEKAVEILDAGADAVVVGDCFHDDPETFLSTVPVR